MRFASAAEHVDPSPGTLYTDPVWLKAYGANALVIVEPVPGTQAPLLVFARERDHLVHLGRLLSLESHLIEVLSTALTRRTGAAFVVFEDVDLTGPVKAGLHWTVFHYQNNWRIVLDGPQRTPISRQTAQGTHRKMRNLLRDHPGASLGFEARPDRGFLQAIVDLGRSRIEAQGKRYGIDATEFERLVAVAGSIGHGAVIRVGDRVVSGGLIGIDMDARLTFEVSDGTAPMQLHCAGAPTVSGGNLAVSLSARPASCKPRDRWLEEQKKASACCAPAASQQPCCGSDFEGQWNCETCQA